MWITQRKNKVFVNKKGIFADDATNIPFRFRMNRNLFKQFISKEFCRSFSFHALTGIPPQGCLPAKRSF